MLNYILFEQIITYLYIVSGSVAWWRVALHETLVKIFQSVSVFERDPTLPTHHLQ